MDAQVIPWRLAGAFPCVLMLLCACVHAPRAHAPPRERNIVFDDLECLPVTGETVRLSIRNVSSHNIGFHLSAFDGHGYRLHPGVFYLLADTGDGEPGIWNAQLEHFAPPEHIARLEPGDIVVFDITPSIWPTAADTGRFIVEVRDTRWRAHRSESAGLCENAEPAANSRARR